MKYKTANSEKIISLFGKNIIYLTGRTERPLCLRKKAGQLYPAWIVRHRDEWILYSQLNTHLLVNNEEIKNGMVRLNDRDEVQVEKSGKLKILLNL